MQKPNTSPDIADNIPCICDCCGFDFTGDIHNISKCDYCAMGHQPSITEEQKTIRIIVQCKECGHITDTWNFLEHEYPTENAVLVDLQYITNTLEHDEDCPEYSWTNKHIWWPIANLIIKLFHL